MIKSGYKRVNESFDSDYKELCKDYPESAWKAKASESACKKFKVFHLNGNLVTSDIDINRALNYQYSTDRDKNLSSYTRDEVQKAVVYYDYKH